MTTKEKAPIWKAWLIACLGVGGHLLLDSTGSVGIRPFLPFSSRWFYLDLNGSYDGALLVVFGLALVWPWFVDLVSSEIGRRGKHRGQGSAIIALVFLLVYEGGRWSLHEGALSDLNARMYDGELPVAAAALPEANNPFAWIGIVETQDAFRVVQTGTLQLGNASDSRVFAKPEKTAAYRAAMTTEPFRYLAYFARFPVWGIETVPVGAGLGKLLDLTDLRFGRPGYGAVHAIAITNGAERVVLSEFSFNTKALQRMRAEAAP